jgi:glutaredoxin-related protein
MSTQRRTIFTQADRKTLFDIIKYGEGGRFFEALRDRDMKKNLEKYEMWTTITRLFNQVKFLYSMWF